MRHVKSELDVPVQALEVEGRNPNRPQDGPKLVEGAPQGRCRPAMKTPPIGRCVRNTGASVGDDIAITPALSWIPPATPLRPRFCTNRALGWQLELLATIPASMWETACAVLRSGVAPSADEFFVQPGIDAARGQQAGVGPTLDDAALVQHEHQVGLADGAEPVGDDERGAPVQENLKAAIMRYPMADP